MNGDGRLIEGDLMSVAGLKGGVAAAGIKPSGKPDVAVIQCLEPTTASAVFTTCRLPAAPVVLSRERLRSERRVGSIVINSGNANAMTGRKGMDDASAMLERIETHCGGPALVFSTGVMATPMPTDAVLDGIDQAAASMSQEPQTGRRLAEAILTTDTFIKTGAVEFELPAKGEEAPRRAVVGGMAKGSGMIHPAMATMLGFLAVDIPLERSILDDILREAVDHSFHEISVDGDTSPNDAVTLLSVGAGEPLAADDPRIQTIRDAVVELCRHLARQIILDGEGMSRLMEVRVTGARSVDDARRAADAVARSSLVKTALAGGDPNWGRVLAAAANAGVELAPERLALELCGIRVFSNGEPLDVDERALSDGFGATEVLVELHLGVGDAEARRLTTDLTTDYVRINSEYTT